MGSCASVLFKDVPKSGSRVSYCIARSNIVESDRELSAISVGPLTEQLTMHRVLVSACLLGERVRHNGEHKQSHDRILQRWLREGCVAPFCPEVAGGLPVPRPAAEIAEAMDGSSVLSGTGRVLDVNGRDVSAFFVAGAQQALEYARRESIRIAVLKEGSPSCGTSFIYDGTFTSQRVPGQGVTVALLRQAGIHAFNEFQFEAADQILIQLPQEDGP